MINIVNLGKLFGSYWAVRNLNLKINKGEFFCFLGPNGAGKTTTIKMLTGIMKPTEGSIFINDRESSKFPEQSKRIIGYIPDSPFLYESLTAQEFLEFIINVYQLDKRETEKKVKHYLNLLRLKGYENVLIKEFSHGMKQRLIYISNLIRDPYILIIDEPLVGLDPYSIKVIKELLINFIHRGGVIFMSTHILSIAEELASRVGIIDKGRLLCQGTLKELKEKESEKLEDIFFRLTE